ncbi:MAG: hypothetical protein EOP83_27250 [Verrucomicrobiaceae bacterium]|nr:MAG: hypothetical protein EOP83_27250 [Verrucomicrobiaceae bacterium]
MIVERDPLPPPMVDGYEGCVHAVFVHRPMRVAAFDGLEVELHDAGVKFMCGGAFIRYKGDDHDRALCRCFYFEDPNAAFEFKMRYG